MLTTRTTIVLNDSTGRFKWLNDKLKKYEGKKIGESGLKRLVAEANNELVWRGFVTTRVLVPNQNLNTSVLHLNIMPGRIGSIKVTGNTRTNWHTAFPINKDDILNYRNLEQGLEQMQRLPSQKVKIGIMPSKETGKSDLNIHVVTSKNMRGTLFLDDDLSAETGKYEAGLGFSLDNMLNLNDELNVYASHDLKWQADNGSQFYNINYSVPYRKWLFNFNRSKYKGNQSLTGYWSDYQYTSDYERTELEMQYLLDRDARSKTYGVLKLGRQGITKKIADVKLNLQSHDVTVGEMGLTKRIYDNSNVYDFKVSCKFGLPWFDSDDDAAGLVDRYKIWKAVAQLSTPLRINNINARYTVKFNGQYSSNNVYSTDEISIGGRYSVRGFDGKQNLSDRSGFYIQNEIAVPSKIGSYYWGLDFGQVYGPYTGNSFKDKTLLGTVVGLRGEMFKSVSYDVFAGMPIFKARNYESDDITLGFRMAYKF